MDLSKMIRRGQPATPPRIVMIGEEGVGKSSFFNEMPNPVFVCAENGLVGPQFANTANYQASSYPMIREFLAELLKGQHDYKTVVIDTVDWLEPLIGAYLCARDKKTSIEEYGYGKGYIVLADEFRLLLSDLEKLNKAGIAIGLLMHCHVKSFANPVGDNYDRFEAKAAKQIAGLAKEWADAVLFARFKIYTHKESKIAKAKGVGDAVRVIQTTKSPAWDAKNRYGLPDELPLSWTAVAEAIAAGTPDKPEAIEAAIKDMIEKSTGIDVLKKPAILEATEKAKGDAEALKKILNRVRQIAQGE